jgi:hypothetical protein
MQKLYVTPKYEQKKKKEMTKKLTKKLTKKRPQISSILAKEVATECKKYMCTRYEMFLAKDLVVTYKTTLCAKGIQSINYNWNSSSYFR